METEATDGYLASNSTCSPSKEHARMLVDLSMTMPNGQPTALQANSPVAQSIKQEEGAEEEGEKKELGLEEKGQNGEEGSGLEEPMIDSPNNLQDGDPRTEGSCDAGARLPNVPERPADERPFQCNQCGVSFTQKGNLLRHIKLHTGEKPFKCPFCSYACRRRDALTGHLRTHSVGKPHKCNNCGRSYKQRASLEEHKERCHSFLHQVNMDAPNSGSYQGEDPPKEQRPLMDAVSVTPFDRPPVIERLQGNVGKRKSTTPQKFVGEKLVRYSYPELPHDVSLKYDREEDLFKAHMMDSAISYLGADALRPFLPHPSISAMNPLFTQPYPLGPRDAPPPPPTLLEFPPPPTAPSPLPDPRTPSPLGSHLATAARIPQSPNSTAPREDRPPSKPHPRPESSPAYGREESQEGAADRAFRGGAFQRFAGDGREVKAFRCGHCRVLFLDHVMYTIHMGCHGYRDPLECNICGHHSQDRYEFSSHIVRGEHTFR